MLFDKRHQRKEEDINLNLLYYNVDSFRQNLQIIYTKRLVDIISNDKGKSYKNHAKSLALYNLNDIMELLNSKGNRSSLAHKMHLKSIIEKALDND